MIKAFILLCLFLANLAAMDIDPKVLQDIIDKNPEAYKEKILLAKYYTKNGNNLKALNILNEVLEKRPNNKDAQELKKYIDTKEHNQGVFRDAGLTQPISSADAQKRLDSYYEANNYQFYSNLYQALLDNETNLNDSYHIKAAYIYLWDGRYKESENSLDLVKEKSNIDIAKIKADICYYTGNYSCAARLYEKLYNSSYNVTYAIKLINSYIYLGQTENAERLYNFIFRKYPKNSELIKLGDKIDGLKSNYLQSKKEAYEKDKSIESLEAYVSALFASGKKDETLKVLHEHNKVNATSRSLLLEAKYLIWSNETDTALEILKNGSLNDDLRAKLMMGQIYSWDNKFDESKKYLNEVIAKAKDKELLYDAKKAIAYVYMWNKETDIAKKIFLELKKENPNDDEIKEALMELNHDYAGLIKIYKEKIKKSSSLELVKRLGQLYINNKQPKMAIKYFQDYVAQNPNDLEATKTLAILLIENKDYYQGFGYLEYYAAQKKTPESSIILAKNYYWSGFSKEALDVLDRLLQEYPNNEEALKLKAQILKIAPRFTTSNSGATISTFFDDLGKKQLEIADSLYFNSHFKASLMYYESYLEKHPDDHEARYRYAFALENSGEYGKAEGEFYLMFWTKDSDELKYHYAYNMMKNGKIKEAKELMTKLKTTIFQAIDPKLDKFIQDWKSAWESLNYGKYTSYYDPSFTKNELWAYKKQQNFSEVTFISVGIYDPIYKKVDTNSYMIKFYQEYATNKGSDKGYKTLYVKCDDNMTECKITKEEWEKGEYDKTLLLTPYIDQNLKEMEFPLANPVSQNAVEGEDVNNNLQVANTNVAKKKIYLLTNIMILS